MLVLRLSQISQKIIRSLEDDIPDHLPDDPTASETPVPRCGQVVMSLNYRFFGIALGGYCLSGSNNLSDYQYVQSNGYRKFRGGYSYGHPVMDIFEITNTRSFSNSAMWSGSGTVKANTSVEEVNKTENSHNSGHQAHCCLLNMLLLACVGAIMVP